MVSTWVSVPILFVGWEIAERSSEPGDPRSSDVNIGFGVYAGTWFVLKLGEWGRRKG